MPEQIEQYMRTLKLGGMAREWRSVEFQSKEQYIRELLELRVGLIREYMEGLQFLKSRENLFFLGSVGTGKTHLATAIALAACQAGRRVRFFIQTPPSCCSR